MMQRVKDSSASRGETITCRAGCGACCRQYVPVSDMEARALAALLGACRRIAKHVCARASPGRGAAAQGRHVGPAGARGRILPSEHMPLVVNYFHLGIPCPFLEDEACSIIRTGR